MGLLDEVRSEAVPPRRNKMDEIREKLNGDDFDDFLKAMAETSISQAAIVRALQKRGIHIGKGTLSEMRREYLRTRGEQ